MSQRASAVGVGMACCAMVVLAACGTVALPAEPIVLRVAGSTAMLPLVADLTTAFAQSQPHVRWELEGGGPALGLQRLEAGEIDIAACSTVTLLGEELPPAGVAIPVARDGLEIIVNARNPVDDITLLQLRDVYAGRALDWSGLAAPPGEILVVSREDGSGTRLDFERMVMGQHPVTLTAVVMPSSRAVLEYVANHQAAIGYVSMGVAKEAAQDDPSATVGSLENAIKGLRIEGVRPTSSTVRNGAYHLVRLLHLVVRVDSGREIRSFVDFARSPAGQAIVGQRYGRIE